MVLYRDLSKFLKIMLIGFSIVLRIFFIEICLSLEKKHIDVIAILDIKFMVLFINYFHDRPECRLDSD